MTNADPKPCDPPITYGHSIEHPDGIPEDPTRCLAEVFIPYTYDSHQCKRSRGHGHGGAYCWQHAKETRP